MEFHSFYQRRKAAFGSHTQKDGYDETNRFFGLRDHPISFLPTFVGPPEWYSLLESSQHAGLSLRRHGIHVRFVVDKVALGQVFLRILQFSPVSIIPPMLHTYFNINAALVRRTTRRRLRTSKKKQRAFANREALERNVLLHCPSLLRGRY
jgi:hypothetical protein